MIWDVRYHEDGYMLPQEIAVHADTKDEAEFIARASMRGQPRCRILASAPRLATGESN